MNTISQAAVALSVPVSRKGDPTWEVAAFFPAQGAWSETDYLELQLFARGESACVPIIVHP